MMKLFVISGAALALTACTATGNVERNALGGAALGAGLGAVIGNNVGDGDASRGAAIGAVIGGGAGAARGVQQDNRTCGGVEFKKPANGQPLEYDRQARRYFYYDRATGNTYWSDGAVRTCGGGY